MQIERFTTREEAEARLHALGYVFMGAPGRWRRLTANRSSYADVYAEGRRWVVVYHASRML